MFTLRKATTAVARSSAQLRMMSQQFARTSTFVLNKKDEKEDVDAIVKNTIAEITSKLDGYIG